MSKSKKKKGSRKKPISLSVRKEVVKKKDRRKVTSEFHRLSYELESLKEKKGVEAQGQIEEIEKQIEEIGGRASYQQASVQATSKFSTSKWVIGDLQRRGFKRKKEKGNPRVLEVGAINTQLLRCKWLDVRAIDLRSCDPLIEKVDFFDLPLNETEKFDIIVCSMVLNCLPTPASRFRMLTKLREHLRNEKSLLYLMLPRSCVDHSQFLTKTDFQVDLLDGVGLNCLQYRETLKIGFWICRRTTPQPSSLVKFQSRKGVDQTSKKSRNYNFNITVEVAA